MAPIKYHNTACDRRFQSESVCGGWIMVFGNAKTAIVGDSMSQDYTIQWDKQMEKHVYGEIDKLV